MKFALIPLCAALALASTAPASARVVSISVMNNIKSKLTSLDVRAGGKILDFSPMEAGEVRTFKFDLDRKDCEIIARVAFTKYGVASARGHLCLDSSGVALTVHGGRNNLRFIGRRQLGL